MSIPITGILLLPLGLLIACLPWRYCLIGLMTMAMMSPAAVVNVGSFGLQPGYYMAILLVGRTALEIITHRFILNAFVLSRMSALWWFTVAVFAVLFIALCFFQGSVDTLPGTYGFKSGLAHPFRPARENFTQIAYLLLNVTLVYALAHNGARQLSTRLVSAWDTAIVWGLCFSVAVCVWQLASSYSSLPFPVDFFYSNAGYSRADSQTLVGLFRINGPFEEPSTLGYTFTGYLLYAWGRYRSHPTPLTIGLIAASIFCLLVSTSTTALVGLFLFLCVVVFDIVTGKVALLRRNVAFSAGHAAVFGLIFIGIVVSGLVLATTWPAIQIVSQDVLFNKTGSQSFQQRSFADYLAFQIFIQTYGIGVGLGSHKANSLVLTLLSNTGAIGLILFGAFVWTLFWGKGVYRNAATSAAAAIRPFQLGLLGLLVIHAIGNPNLSTLTLWLLMGAVLAIQAAEHGKAAPIQSVPKPQLGVAAAARRAAQASV
jgi:hypothetical protein